MTPQEAYRVLSVEPGADPKEVQRVYREQALKWHPDRTNSEVEARGFYQRFLKIRDAYECLRQAGFPMPEPEQVADVPADWSRWLAGRSFAPKGPTEDVSMRQKLGFKPLPDMGALLVWIVLLPAAAIVLIYFLKFLLAALRSSGAQAG